MSYSFVDNDGVRKCSICKKPVIQQQLGNLVDSDDRVYLESNQALLDERKTDFIPASGNVQVFKTPVESTFCYGCGVGEALPTKETD